MDDDGGGGVGEFEGFPQRRAGGKSGGEICRDRIASAHNVYLAA